MKITLVCFVLLISCPAAFCQLSNGDIDAIAKELEKEPPGVLAKAAHWLSQNVNMDWPVKNEDVRDSWDIDPEQDTDDDGTPDVDDDDIDGDGKPNAKDKDIDGDGIKNWKDKNPYDSTKSFMPNGGSPKTDDSDGDGMPDWMDNFPDDPKKSFRNRVMEKNKDQIINSLFVKQAKI